MLYMGEGLRGSNGACSTLHWTPIFHSATHNQTGPLWCWFPSGWACAHSRPLWVSPTTSPVGLGVSPAAAPTPMGIFFFFFLNFYCYSITVVCLFSPSLHPTPGEPTSLPHLHPPPWFCPCVLYSSSCNPLYPLSPPPPPTPALAIVRLFSISMSLFIFCLLFSSVDYIPVKGRALC